MTYPKRQIEKWEWADFYQSKEMQREIKETRKRIFELSNCLSHPVSRSVNEEFVSTLSSETNKTEKTEKSYKLVES